MTDDVDPGLIERARSGDRGALEELVRGTIGSLRIFLLSVSPPGTSVDDIVQETYLTAYSGLGEFDTRGPGAFLSWLCGIGRNMIRRELRRRAYEARARDAFKDMTQMAEWEEIAETPAELVGERAARLRGCLEKLPAAHRELVALRYGKGLSYDRIARKLRQTAGWARTTVFRARQLLRRCIEGVDASHA